MNPQWIMTFEKFMSEAEVKALRKILEAAVIIAKSKAHQVPVRDHCIIELALGTGLRVSEISTLKVEDIDLKRGGNSLIVRHGKGNRLREVKFSSSLKTLIQEYLGYRRCDSVFLFPSQRQDHMFPTAIQKVFKKWAKRAGLPARYSIHSCRHTYATNLYRISQNLRLVQLQLGHSNPQTTSVYAAVLDEDIKKAVEKL
ncbi:MAG: tyrosine-type recombinase/integrase [Candidatus Marinimicrobia bacterium]|jgi:integrase/recombinase XerD|nr:tyrosine-type recombinase/integrase [Candidatus Neomarinimicrobiota bacterium]MBT4361994.1 tyrosine-type recombinase/integrase [Candidatus Neomarinimicrobiota bacterium]MBT4716078.1 tyrosine-type recombinase/integrase [Candidatus Neomarinimicrobiota bacterium]MBT4945937.1 tyrosine-type recombinase/integrase [Candidatus Neomarinimicrobiota bacterium]MBT6013056.1 tyrosine-type recombinase/integrase [Candidatus Neomarinimicrobiota bacterium]